MSRVLPLITTVDLWRTYLLGSEEINALRGVNFSVMPGQFIAVVGRSGSGKTTLLNILAGLDKPTSGRVMFQIGFVFQSFGLLPLLSALENVELPLRIAGVRTREREERTRDALEIVGLWNRAKHRPYELSGGEQQRVAIARAIVNEPPLILADEPTGELDSNNARSIFGLFKEMVQNRGISVVSATHDSTLLEMADEVKEIRDGQLSDATDLGRRYRD